MGSRCMVGTILAHLPEPEALLTVFHILAHKALTPPVNQEVDVLAQIQALATCTRLGKST